MKLTIDIELSPEREKWATNALQNDVAAKETEATTLEEYLAPKLQPFVEEKLNEITDSWRPVDAPEVAAKRDSVAELLKEIPADKLEEIEAAIIAASGDK